MEAIDTPCSMHSLSQWYACFEVTNTFEIQIMWQKWYLKAKNYLLRVKEPALK